jgi:hypothetical protein
LSLAIALSGVAGFVVGGGGGGAVAVMASTSPFPDEDVSPPAKQLVALGQSTP